MASIGTQVVRRSLTATLAAALLFSAWVSTAEASCTEPEPALVWSYPGEGDSNVPTNSHLWLVTSAAPASISLNGASLEAEVWTFGAQELTPAQALEPNTDYTLALTVGQESPETFEVHFRTGAGKAESPPAPPEPVRTTYPGDSEQRCNDVVQTQDCFDTGQNTFVRFATEVEGALAYTLVPDDGYPGASAVWPAGCGAPTVFTWAGEAGVPECYEVRAIGPGGLVGEAVRHCPRNSEVEDGSDAGGVDGGGTDAGGDAKGSADAGGGAAAGPPLVDHTGDGDGCSTGGGDVPSTSLVVLLVLVVVLRARRGSRSAASVPL